MLTRFISFIKEQSLFSPADRVLLAVSGGLDSMVMTDLCHKAGYRFGIAHCNFQLRGDESNKDERFVESVASRYDVPFYSTRFCTTEFAEIRKISIQMAARELRYAWFEEIRHQGGFDLIATAHHQDDQVETFFINLLRSTGLAGLHGIPVKSGKIVRPLLFTTREEIVSFAMNNHITFREDSSNSQQNYTRNKIRHQLIPPLASIEPDYKRKINATIERIQGIESILKPLVKEKRNKLIREEEGKWIIEIDKLRKLDPLQPWMYEILSPFWFNEATIKDIIRSLDNESGKSFFSPSYRIIKDRNQLIITSHGEADHGEPSNTVLIEEETDHINTPIPLSLSTVIRGTNFQISHDKNRATLDKKKLTFPLILRHWQPGDYFYPYGMNKRKKLSDFFIDEKVSIPNKESCWLLCSGDQIVWVIGHRIDNRFKISNRTKNLLVVDLLPYSK